LRYTKKAFSLIEVFLTIALIGVMVVLLFSYINISTLTKQNTQTEFQSHLNIITATILQCKEYSNDMPIQDNGSLASDTLLETLECNTTIPYKLDGGKGSFIPKSLNGFSSYTAKESASEFYFTTTTNVSTENYEVLQDLETKYSSQQYELTDDGTTAKLNFYLSH